ncbi:MAG TPA: carboxypeptidase M32 [Fimbriimonadaceae bacterium]|nr:carboxypeptidase M32 [Fimbriimonadaceae bacterium]HRJ34141.1 carboxypeptidase M32 [Fimbriimonadaceae bacterium]
MSALVDLKNRLAEINAIYAAAGMMSWDQQCYMPPGAGAARATHLSILSRMAHEMFTADEVAKALTQARSEVDPQSEEGALLRVVQRDFDMATKIPTALVEEKSRLEVESHEAWVAARKNNDFASFAPMLERMMEITRQEAEALGYRDHIYDAVLDRYEEGATAADVRAMFDTLRTPLVKLVQDIQERGKPTHDAALTGDWDQKKQSEFTELLAKSIGFDFTRGRQDTAHHPFCTGWSVNDVRITTRYLPYIGSAIFGTLHEAGHGMYEQNSPEKWDLTPLAGGVSLGIHESQSRLWENIVGRSRAFWRRFLPDLHSAFPALASMDLETWYRAINQVKPSLIRVEADEVTYNLHIMVRFEIECALLEGSVAVRDLPEIWNQKYQEYLGITPPNDSDGVLQDVHWSAGLVGYFPTYSMGNLLSYQFWNAMKKDLGDLDQFMADGQFTPILGWLKEKIYSQGRRYTPRDLVMQVTGKPMGAEDYLEGLTAKYRGIYDL